MSFQLSIYINDSLQNDLEILLRKDGESFEDFKTKLRKISRDSLKEFVQLNKRKEEQP